MIVGRSAADRAKVLRDACRSIEERLVREGDYVQALAFERLAANGSDANLALLSRMVAL